MAPITQNFVKNTSVSPNIFISGSFTISVSGSQVTASATCFFTAQVVTPFFTMGTTSGGTDVVPSTTLTYSPSLSIGNYAYTGTYTGTLSGGLIPGFTVNSVSLSYTDFNTSVLLSDVANQGSSISIACFVKGTHIETPKGPVCIEDLKVGDLVNTPRGVAVPIRKIGNWKVVMKKRSRDGIVFKIPSGRLGAKEDVFVSHNHAIQLETGRFIRAYLASLPLATVDEIGETYTLYNVQLENHRVNRMIVGGGVVAESWNGINPDRSSFHVTAFSPFTALHRSVARG